MPIVLIPPSEHERTPLPTRLAALGRGRKFYASAASVLGFLAALTIAIAIVCGLDAWLHLGALVRGIALVATLALGGALWFGRIRPALRLPTEALAIALELEARFPRLNDSLASAVSFLSQDPDPALGGDPPHGDRGVSRGLQAAAVRRAERLAERHNFDAIAPVRRFWFAFFLAGVALLVSAPLALWHSRAAATALVRFADPFGKHPWPARTQIQILAPQPLPARIPTGESFEIRFAIQGEVPDRVSVSFQIRGGEEFEEVYSVANASEAEAGDPESALSPREKATIIAKFEAGRFSRSFAFRIRANDADTGWQQVELAPPPRLVPLEGRASPQIHSVPPVYTGLSPADLPDGAGVIEVPQGSSLVFLGASDSRLASAVLLPQGERAPWKLSAAVAALNGSNAMAAIGAPILAQALGAPIPLTISGDGKLIHGAFTPSLSGMYLLKLTDETGLHGTRLLEIRLLPDPSPTVALLRPALGRDPAIVIPEAVITLHVSAEDKVYAVRRAVLEYRVGRDGAWRSIRVPDATAAALGAAVRWAPTRHEAALTLPVAAFLREDGAPVRDGDTVILRAAATDWDDVSVQKEPGRSGEFELRIASREAIEALLQRELAALRPELIRAREQQRDAAEKAAPVRALPNGTLAPADRERLLGAEYAQRQVRGRLDDPRDGLRTRAQMLREMARANGLPRSRATDKASIAAAELARLADRELPPIEPLLGDARQLGVQPAKPPAESPVPGMLRRAARHQKAVDDSLTRLIELLAEWGDAGALHGDARLLRQGVLREANVADRLPMLVPPGKLPETLTPDQRNDLDRAAGRIDQLAEQSNGLLNRAAKLAGEKEKQAGEAEGRAKAKEAEAEALQKKGASLPPNSPARNAAEGKAALLREQAGEAGAAAGAARTEAEALRQAIERAGGQALPDELHQAAEAMRANRQGESAKKDRSAADRLERLAEALAERPTNDVPELAKKKKRLADHLDSLAGQQDELRKKAQDAARNPNSAQREVELKKLAREQQKLVDEARDLLQKLQRERSDEAANNARAALDKMETARDDLERGLNPENDQKDATNRLDSARDQLDSAVAQAPKELSDEKRRKLANLVKALYERQAAAALEANRLQQKVLAEKKWARPTLQSYKDLEDRERALGVEVRTLAEREFAGLLVFERIVKDAADGIEKAAAKAKSRRLDVLDSDPDLPFDADLEKVNAARVHRPMNLASRRLKQVLDALNPDPAAKKKDEKKKDGDKADSSPSTSDAPMPQGNPGNGDIIPPLAQLKALRALQAELNQQTADFDKRHPKREQLTDDDREELKEIETAQREIATLFEEIAKLFQMKEQPPEEK